MYVSKPTSLLDLQISFARWRADLSTVRIAMGG
jgi:hypothetical protein